MTSKAGGNDIIKRLLTSPKNDVYHNKFTKLIMVNIVGLLEK